MEIVLKLICRSCRLQLMKQDVSCSLGSRATINVDECERIMGYCCEHPDRVAVVEVVKPQVVLDSE